MAREKLRWGGETDNERERQGKGPGTDSGLRRNPKGKYGLEGLGDITHQYAKAIPKLLGCNIICHAKWNQLSCDPQCGG